MFYSGIAVNSDEGGSSPYIFKKGDMNHFIAVCPDILGLVKYLKLDKQPCNLS